MSRPAAIATDESAPSAGAAQALLGDDGVLMRAEHVLELLRGAEEGLPWRSSGSVASSRRVPHTLARDPQPMHRRVIRLGPGAPHGLSQPGVLAPDEPAHAKLAPGEPRAPSLGDEPLDEREVARAREGGEHLLP